MRDSSLNKKKRRKKKERDVCVEKEKKREA
jgi:hypothetical protein